MPRDRLFSTRKPVKRDFVFDKSTARVFDDMIGRSVPFYHEIQRMVCELSAEFSRSGTNLYDLGCATGTTLLQLDAVLEPTIRFVGVDNSADMLAEAEAKLSKVGLARQYELRVADLQKDLTLENASVVIMLLTLQFVRPPQRGRLIQRIAHGLNDRGCLLLVEKVVADDPVINRLFIDNHVAMKRRNGYSRMEIAKKREALENVLIPYRVSENREALLEAGFRSCDEFFRWYGFVGFIAVK